MVEKHRKHCNILYYITVENLIRFIWYFRMHRLFNTSCFVFRFLRKTNCVRFGKAGAHPQLAWESQLPLKPCISLQPLDFKSNCDSSDWFLDVCFISWCSFDLLRKCGLLAHTSAAFLKNCCTEKLFICLRLIIDKPLFLEKPPESDSARLGHIPSLPWESQLPLKPCISLQPSDFEGNCDSLRFSPRFLLQFHSTVRFASQMWATRPHLGSIFEKLLHRKTFYLPAAYNW